MTLRELVAKSHNLAREKGWWDGEAGAQNIPEKLALIHSEVSEALEEYRKPDSRLDVVYYSPGTDCEKPEGFGIELADAVIRIADLCGWLGIDLQAMVDTKHSFNERRERRHGGKRA